jgi:hypothetical protein
MKKTRRLLRQALKARLHSDLMQMAADQRSRKQMVEDCQARHAGYGGHGISHKNIAEAMTSINSGPTIHGSGL